MFGDTDQYVRQLRRSWLLLLLRGCLLVVLGAVALLRPTTDTTLITTLVGVFLLIDGAALLALGFFGRNTTPNARADLLRGAVSLALGTAAVVVPHLARTAAVYLAAFGLIVAGGFEVWRAVQERDSAEIGGSSIAFGLLWIGVGVALALLPNLTGETVIRVIGLAAVPVGLYLLVYATRLRRAIRALTAASG